MFGSTEPGRAHFPCSVGRTLGSRALKNTFSKGRNECLKARIVNVMAASVTDFAVFLLLFLKSIFQMLQSLKL